MQMIHKIRNFSIIAHIDHGKSTISDRFIELCNGLKEREMKEQVLDSMDIERERGITIKAQSVTLYYTANSGETYQLNFIDTPGHADFSYEVSRSLAACEGALLIVDASSSVQAQTVANYKIATSEKLAILPVINKIDLPSADIERTLFDLENIVKIDIKTLVMCSAKTGEGIRDILEQIVNFIPAPKGDETKPFKALIIDSWFDAYLGVVSLVRIYDGCLNIKDKIRIKSTGRIYTVENIGIFTPKKTKREKISAGEVGFIIAGIKDIYGAPVGDTILSYKDETLSSLPGFRKVKPQIYVGMFPIVASDFENFRKALQKLSLNDASLTFQPEFSQSLGYGFRCGLLGLLHLEVIQERLEREYNLNLITSSPSVTYKIVMHNGKELFIDNPSAFPNKQSIKATYEPRAMVTIISPQIYLGGIITLCNEKRGIQHSLEYSGDQITIVYDLPMLEVIGNLSDRLKSLSHGYASFDYSFYQYSEADVVVLNILINDKEVDAMAHFIHRSQAVSKGRLLVEKLASILPRNMFEIKIQAAIGSMIIARSTIKAFRKDVTAKCYGGDVTRKRKLLEKQKEGKKRMKSIGKVEVPESAFFAILTN